MHYPSAFDEAYNARLVIFSKQRQEKVVHASVITEWTQHENKIRVVHEVLQKLWPDIAKPRDLPEQVLGPGFDADAQI